MKPWTVGVIVAGMIVAEAVALVKTEMVAHPLTLWAERPTCQDARPVLLAYEGRFYTTENVRVWVCGVGSR